MAYTAQPVGFLASVVARARVYTDEPSFAAKYPTDILYPIIESAWDRAMREANAVADNAIVVRYSLAIDPDTAVYYLPPTVGQVLRFGKARDTGLNPDWIIPRSRLNPAGGGIIFEGPNVRFEPRPTTSETLTIEYIPNGHCTLHSSTVTEAAFTSTTSFTLDNTPDEGYFDRRPNAYLGAVWRLLSGPTPAGRSYCPVQERVITGYNSSTGAVTFDVPLDVSFSGTSGNYVYEVVPLESPFFLDAVAWDVATTIHGIGDNGSKAKFSEFRYMQQMRLIRLSLGKINQRSNSLMRGDIVGADVDSNLPVIL